MMQGAAVSSSGWPKSTVPTGWKPPVFPRFRAQWEIPIGEARRSKLTIPLCRKTWKQMFSPADKRR